MLSLMPFTPRYAIFYAIYPKLCYRLCHIPRSSAIFFLNVMLQYITLTPSYANSSYAMFSGQSQGHISGYCCIIAWRILVTQLETLQLVLLQFWPSDLSRYRDRTARSVPKTLAAFCKNLKLIEGFIALFTPSERLGLFSLCQ